MTTTASPSSAPIFLRRYGRFDGLLAEVDRALTVLSGAATAARPYPARKRAANNVAAGHTASAASSSQDTITPDPSAAAAGPAGLTLEEARSSAAMMRVNHVGEVCAQALYRGQAAACKDEGTKTLLRHAASEEVDHLAWCDQRLAELNSRPSLLNPLWYAGSFTLGVLAGYAGVPRNLGFMAETERQVEAHLDGHLQALSRNDQASRQVIEQMKTDEIAHRLTAERAGAQPLPYPVKTLMRAMSKVMTTTAKYI